MSGAESPRHSGRLPFVSTCEKCGCGDIYTRYHALACSRDGCACASNCPYGSHNKRHDEHLHNVCRGCGWDWTEDVLDPLATDGEIAAVARSGRA